MKKQKSTVIFRTLRGNKTSKYMAQLADWFTEVEDNHYVKLIKVNEKTHKKLCSIRTACNSPSDYMVVAAYESHWLWGAEVKKDNDLKPKEVILIGR